jgi:hypothetical protein
VLHQGFHRSWLVVLGSPFDVRQPPNGQDFFARRVKSTPALAPVPTRNRSICNILTDGRLASREILLKCGT